MLVINTMHAFIDIVLCSMLEPKWLWCSQLTLRASITCLRRLISQFRAFVECLVSWGALCKTTLCAVSLCTVHCPITNCIHNLTYHIIWIIQQFMQHLLILYCAACLSQSGCGIAITFKLRSRSSFTTRLRIIISRSLSFVECLASCGVVRNNPLCLEQNAQYFVQ